MMSLPGDLAMNFALTVSLCLAGGGQPDGQHDPGKPLEAPAYWYGDPPRQLSAAEVQQGYPQAAFATLDATECAAIIKLKAVGFTLPNRYSFKFVMMDGKRVVVPPQGIILASPQLNRQPMKVLTPKDLAPLADLHRVVTLYLGGRFVHDETLDLLRNMDELCDLGITTTRITDAGLKKLGCLKKLQRLQIASADITDAGLATLATFPALDTITLFQTPRVTDAGVAALGANPNLRILSLADPGREMEIGDAGLASLAGLPKLTRLALTKSRVTDKGLAEMAKAGHFPSLASLDVSCTAVSDKGLKSLHDPKALPALEVLIINRSQVTPEGVILLQKARPGLRVMAMYPNGTPFESTAPGKIK